MSMLSALYMGWTLEFLFYFAHDCGGIGLNWVIIHGHGSDRVVMGWEGLE